MYFLERGFQWSKTLITYEEAREEYEKEQRQPGQTELHAPEGVGDSASKKVYDNDSLYSYSEQYIDLRTPSDEKRGVITFFAGCIYGMIIHTLALTLSVSIPDLTSGYRNDGELLKSSDYFFLILFPILLIVLLAVFLKYTFRFFRLESLTARRIIVRFNRVTRKVYLLRPKHLGGILIMDWDKTEILLDKKMSELEGTGGFLILVWDRGDGVDLQGTPTDNLEVTFVGKPTRNASELLAFWEYIRRYMEDGPAAAPAPKKLLSKFPWPWLSFKAAWGLDTHFLRHTGLWVFVAINVLLLPAILIHATGHWLSLLLCYEPRFPREIEEAGRE
ncbi:DUF6708 domain-containing protein [Pseudomonas plecoglossicida]|uniref:DUF6708 domain-containing protein n=1 Tax=Pseudomonas plecoglossicida TaxID=70775 RepID=A0AAD0R048_PSEDL|nr:DUF6708 domain-containing protein [Pseudomonas plecoglossicida]AXM98843.1 hypothetical protein DVB73_25110 [Pseudomonas plecoglossicida]QLB54990.1 hypothetical protein HAV28_09110 [Pseudomonas plecoglossicida]